MDQMAENDFMTPEAVHDGGDTIISIRDLVVGFGARNTLDGLSFDVRRGEVLGIVGPSGTGKSVTLRTIIGLIARKSGSIKVFGKEYAELPRKERLEIEKRWGVLFQQGALFSSMTVLENIELPMREYTDFSAKQRTELARIKLDLVGLKQEAAERYPSELSGGMIKRAALARALALDPEILFLDEPTAGLDPIGAAKFDELILALRDTLGLTVYMVTHDLDSLATICDRIAVLSDGKLLQQGTLAELRRADHPWLIEYFHGPRARNLGVE
jgi:phospholipid/cholesterol/gamma-HCH transport system ATP-binding protein